MNPTQHNHANKQPSDGLSDHVAMLDADVLDLAGALDRLAASDLDAVPAGLDGRVVAATLPVLSSSLAPRRAAADAAPASIPISIPVGVPIGVAIGAARGTNRSGLLSPMRLAASVAIGAAVLGALLAQRPGTSQSGATLAADRGGLPVRVAIAGLTSADIALGEEFLDIIAPSDLAGTDASSPEASLTAEFWSLDTFSEESL